MIAPAALSRSIASSAPWPGGGGWNLWCRALGGAVVEWLSSGGVVLTGVATGAAGSGTVTGTLTFPAPPPLVVGALTAAGLTGSAAAGVGAALAAGLAASFTGAPYAGPVAGVAAGSDVTTVVAANVPLLIETLTRHHNGVCGAVGGRGAQTPVYHAAAAAAVGAWFAVGVGTGVVAPVGAAAPFSAVGTSSGRFV